LGSKESSKRAFIEKAKEKGVDEIIEFPAILRELIKFINTETSYDSEVLQTLRLLKIYDLVKV